MSLYNRDYINEQAQTATEHRLSDRTALSAFIRKTYQLFAASLIAGAAGAYVGMGFAGTIAKAGLWVLVPWIAMLFILKAVRHKPVINYIMLFAFTFFGGLIISPMIMAYVSMGAGHLVTTAFILTAVAFGGLSLFAMTTKRDFSVMGKMLFIILLVVVAASIINLFIQSSFMGLAISVVAVILFSAYILYDTQNIIKGAYETPIEGAIALYLDVFNLFVHLLNILGIMRD
ncbi:MAG: Bax inhibitor-1/YccA family protein [Campylobacteraceae bacterium]|nr:Bax inhibitor-1/YccA family protein [Campylobacteraceae bacterium]